MEHIYTTTFRREGRVVDQFLVIGDRPFEEAVALAEHRKWHSKWPEHLRPDTASIELNQEQSK